MNDEANDLRQWLALRSRLPPEKSLVSLCHAISWIALRRSIASPVLSKLLGIGKPLNQDRDVRNRRLDRAIRSALEKLIDLGSDGRIEILGKKYSHVLAVDDDDRIPTERILAEQLIDYRGFDTLDDSLFPEPYRKVKLAWELNRREIHSPLGKHYRFVMVNRANLMREFPDNSSLKSERTPFTIAEIGEWIRSTTYTGMKVARNAFMKEPRAKGLSAAFETEWRDIKKNKVGRPRLQ